MLLTTRNLRVQHWEFSQDENFHIKLRENPSDISQDSTENLHTYTNHGYVKRLRIHV